MSSTPTSSEIYYKEKYWNDHRCVLEYMMRSISDPLSGRCCWWPDYLKEKYLGDTAFERVLFINCGNGWVERELYERGIFTSSVSFDYSPELLATARGAAAGRPLSYFRADCNHVSFPDDAFDAVFNVAAMHHVARIDRMNRMLARALKPGGLFVNFDYVGPHRNQYGKQQFGHMQRVNDLLPPWLRARLKHPHLETMLAHDPTEAIHSELVLPMFSRYFFTVERKDLKGGLIYQIMHNNHALFEDRAEPWVKFLVDLDELYSHFEIVPPLFSFYIGKPRKELLLNEALLTQYAAEEDRREAYGHDHGGRYEYRIELPEE